MKTIVCYGDSNTWGYIPGTGQRYARELRWPAIVQRRLGTKVFVAEEGLSGRYTIFDEPFRPGRNGAALLQPILETHKPVDVLVLMLGTNDVLHFRDNTAFDAARGVELLIKLAQRSETGPGSSAPQILLVAPPLMTALSEQLQPLCHGDPAKAAEFAFYYRQIAVTHGVHYCNAAEICSPSPVDGVHLDEQGHKALSNALTEKLAEILNINT